MRTPIFLRGIQRNSLPAPVSSDLWHEGVSISRMKGMPGMWQPQKQVIEVVDRRPHLCEEGTASARQQKSNQRRRSTKMPEENYA